MDNPTTPDLLTSSEQWMQQPLEHVYVQSLHPLRSSYHVACVEARSTATDMIKIFQFNMTKQELGAYAYLIEPGCIIMDRSGTYECLAVSYGKMPKAPVVLARPIIRFDSSNAGDRFTVPTFLDEKAHIRDRFILYKEWFTLPVSEVNIESVIFKKGEHDFRWSRARSSGNDLYRFYQLENTRRDFNAVNFQLEPGCVLRDKTGTYRCLSLFFPSKPAYPLFFTQKVG